MFLFRKKADSKKENIEINAVDEEQLYAPVSGRLIALEKVDDVVFSQKIMGEGIAIEPEEGGVYAPMEGVVSVVFPTKHVIGIEAKNGASIIMHMGIDTVELQGRGFDVFVKQGDAVRPGELLMKLNLELIRQKYPATTMIVVENWKDYQITCTEQERVKAGDKLLKLARE